MFGDAPRFFSAQTHRRLLFVIWTLAFLALIPATASAQKTGPDGQPAFSGYKGIQIGMPAIEARKKLGSPKDKSDDQDFYLINDNQAVQVFYDKEKTVTAISIDFMNGATGIPSCKEVLGDEVQAKPDGSVYKLTRYPKAGYWVSYSRTAGDSPTVTITMQRLEH